MPVFSYRTIQAPAEGQFKQQGSRFLAFAFPVLDEKEVKEQLGILRKKYHDARHQGYAYVLGPGMEKFRAVDDGEPNHSTGDPILRRIRSRNLTNTLVVVVRYFGGIKLGVSGLIASYRSAAAEALNAAIIVEREVMFRLEVRFDLAATPEVMKLVRQFHLSILSQEYGDKGQLMLEGQLRRAEEVKQRVTYLRATGTPIEPLVGIQSGV